MMVGIPIYSDVSTIHDYVVQSDGAFDETIQGILNLKRYGQKVEIRIVVHRQIYARLLKSCEKHSMSSKELLHHHQQKSLKWINYWLRMLH
jgi:MoaA/NifB/PqqE/SkfB family radical SAM enzyme